MTPSMPDNIHTISDGADANAPSRGDAEMRPSTPTLVVALPSGGEAPAAKDDEADVGEAKEKVANDHSKSGGRIETGVTVEAEALMTVKEELAFANMKENGSGRTPDDKRARNAKGGDDEIRENADEGVMLPHETNVWRARV